MKILRKIVLLTLLFFGFIQINAQTGWTADLRVEHENYIGGIGNKEINVGMVVDLYDNNTILVAPQPNYKYEFYRKYILEANPQWIEYATSPQWGYNTQGTHTYQDSTWVPQGKFQIKCKITLPDGTIVNSDVITIPWYSVLPNQKNNSGVSFGTIKYWYKGNLKDNNGIATIYFPRYEAKVLQAETNIVNSEKYNYWQRDNSDMFYNNFVKFSTAVLLNTTMQSQFNPTKNATVRAKVENLYLDVINFKDPWIRDFNEPPFGLRNQGLFAQPQLLSNVANNLAVSTNHQGVLLNQDYNIPGNPYYEISIDSTININGKQHKIYPIDWDVTNAQIQYPNKLTTGVVFTNDNAVVTANLKGSLISNTASAFANSGQRKVITTQNGTMYLAYESMNSVWLEKSMDNGTTWQLMNNGKLNGTNFSGESPSLLLDNDAGSANNIYMVYEEYDGLESHLNIAYLETGNNTPKFNNQIPNTTMLHNNGIDFQPVIAKTDYSKILVIYKLSSAVTSNPGLYYYLGGHNNSDNPVPTAITWYGTPLQLGNTSNNSSNPAITVKQVFPKGPFHLAWQEGNTKINYYQLLEYSTGTTWAITQNGYKVISSGSGYTNNENPTITMYSGQPQVNWIGTKTIFGKIIGEIQTSTTYRKVIKRGIPQTGSWGIFYETGNDVINTSSNNTTNGDYVIAWVEENAPGNYVDKVVKNISSNKAFSLLGATAKYLQLGNGATTNNMYAATFKDNLFTVSV